MFPELNNSQALLMYLADELPAEKRAELELRLKGDAALQRELHELEEAVDAFQSGMSALDAATLTAQPAALRRIGLSMRSHMARRQVAIGPGKAATAVRGARMSWWAYPAMTAAAVVVLCLSWWGHQPDGKLVVTPIVPPHAESSTTVTHASSGDDEKLVASVDVEKELKDVGENPTQPATSIASLEIAEQQIAELTNRGSDPLESLDGHE